MTARKGRRASNFGKEPTLITKREIGILCQAWTFLETQSDLVLHGLIRPNEDTREILNSKMEMRSKWETILARAKLKLPEADRQALKTIAKRVELVTGDRNIIVHGAVHATSDNPGVGFWCLWKGANAGKRYPISTQAVKTVRENVQKVAHEVRTFALAHQFQFQQRFGAFVRDWPKPLE